MGMDEFHQSTVAIGRQQMQEFAEMLKKAPPTELSNGEQIKKLGAFHYLHRTRLDIEDVTILGCTLWRRWKEKSYQARGLANGAYRPIKDFFAEDEASERDLDLAWLHSQLVACANGGAAAPAFSVDEAMVTPPEQSTTELAAAPMDEDEHGIYNDVEMLPLDEPTDLPGGRPSEGVPTPPEPSESISIPPSTKRQGPPRRVIILTAHPPTFEGTTISSLGPVKWDQTKEAAFVLQGRQCWALDNGTGHGVVVSSIHGNNDPRPQQRDRLKAEAEQPAAIKMSETLPCGHDSGLTGDPYRPPGVALWAFGYTGWSCDISYEAPVTVPPVGDPDRKKAEVAESSANGSNRCPQCNRAPGPIRLVSNQRGQQWERSLVPYVSAPHTWRAFDESLVVDV